MRDRRIFRRLTGVVSTTLGPLLIGFYGFSGLYHCFTHTAGCTLGEAKRVWLVATIALVAVGIVASAYWAAASVKRPERRIARAARRAVLITVLAGVVCAFYAVGMHLGNTAFEASVLT